MDTKDNNQFTYKDSNIMRFAGLLFLVISPWFFLLLKSSNPVFGILNWLFLALSLMMILFSSNLTITADKSTRILYLRYSFLLFRRTKDIPFDDIADIQSQESVNTRKASTRGYRLVAVFKDRTILPFRSYFTRHDNKKQ